MQSQRDYNCYFNMEVSRKNDKENIDRRAGKLAVLWLDCFIRAEK